MKQLLQPTPVGNRFSTALLILRVVTGLAFIFHGYGKIQNPFSWMGPQSSIPGIFQALAAISEFCGGLAWILGLFTPVAAFGIACTMIGAVWTHLVVRGDPFVATSGGSGYELASVYLCIALLFLLVGPGRFSLDAWIFGQRGLDRGNRSGTQSNAGSPVS